MEHNRLVLLIDSLLENKISDTDRTELLEFMENNRSNGAVTSAFAQLLQEGGRPAGMDSARWEEAIQVITNADKIRRIHPLKRSWFKYSVAAAMVLAIGAFLFFSNTNKKINPPAIASTDKPAPSSMVAVLTLANGERITIDSASAGTLAVQASTGIQLSEDGQIIYSGAAEGVNNADVQYNSFSVPRGSRIATILLSDGTKVYINAGSTLKYPVVFARSERRVEITGEAFFDVAPDKNRKFTVSDGKSIVEVLGTEFNINAYPDEQVTNTTLVSGAVRVGNIQESVVLKPGQQCVDNRSGDLAINEHANIEEAVAWKDGLFYFEEASLKTIARQASRWYNVNFVFENKHAETEIFHGKFSRNSSLAELLQVLAYSDVKFKIEGNEVIIR